MKNTDLVGGPLLRKEMNNIRYQVFTITTGRYQQRNALRGRVERLTRTQSYLFCLYIYTTSNWVIYTVVLKMLIYSLVLFIADSKRVYTEEQSSN